MRLTVIVLGAVVAILVLAVSSVAQPGPASDPLAVVHVDVIPMDYERVLPDRTVVIEDGRIAAMGPGGEVAVPEGAAVVEGRSRFLMPGLFDTHVHFGRFERDRHPVLYLANGITTVQSMHGSPAHLELRRRVEEGELLGPRVLTTGPTTATVGISTPEEARALVREQVAAGYDAVKQYGVGDESPRETYAALASAAREAGIRLVGHAPRELPFSAVLEERQSSIDHMEEIVYTSEAISEAFGPYLDIQSGRVPPPKRSTALEALPVLDALEPAIEELAREVAASGLAVTPTLVAFETIGRQVSADFEEQLDDPRLAYIHPFTRIEWGPAFNRYRTGWSDRLEVMDRILHASLELQKRMTRAFHRAGVDLMTGTDAPLTFVFPGSSLHRELELLVESGLSPYAALRAATAVPAGRLGLAGEVGTIAVGKRADLVLVEANPLEDVGHARRIVGVVAAGRWLSRARLDRELEELADSYRPLAERARRIAAAIEAGDAETALEVHAGIEEGGDALDSFVERAVNSLGYRFLRAGEVERAIQVFTRNTEAFPEAWNVWDSLGEAYMEAGEDAKAIESYERSLELNPGNANARRMLERIRAGRGNR